MKISAVIPTYNYAHYLPFAIESVLSQKRPLDEIVVIDDGSTDNTREVAARYEPSIRYVYQKNAGLSAARNAGTRLATGDWVAYLDSDDGWAPEKILRQEQVILDTPGAVVAYTGYLALYPDGSKVQGHGVLKPSELWPALRAQNFLPASSVMAHRASVLEAGGFDQKLTSCEDWDLWVRLKSLGEIAGTVEPLTIVRQTPGSMSSNIQRMIDNMEAIRENTLLHGLTGTSRYLWTRKIRSVASSHAALTAREFDSSLERGYLLKSLRYWPFPARNQKRFAGLLRNIIGPKAFALISNGLRSSSRPPA